MTAALVESLLEEVQALRGHVDYLRDELLRAACPGCHPEPRWGGAATLTDDQPGGVRGSDRQPATRRS